LDALPIWLIEDSKITLDVFLIWLFQDF